MVFDDSAARGSAIPTPSEGMVTYLKDTDSLDKFDGTNFVPVDTGGLIAVKSALFTGTQVASSVASGGNVAVTDLSITHEVSNPANKLIISAFLGTLSNSEDFAQGGIAIHDGTGLIAVGNTAGSRTSVTAGGQGSPAANANVSIMPSVTFVHTPGAGSKTYTVRAVNINLGTRTLAINRTSPDSDAANQVRSVSSLVIQEVAV